MGEAAGALLFLLILFFAAFAFLINNMIEWKKDKRLRKVNEAHNYRKHLVHMTVAGKVRQLAEKQELNLDEEEALFMEYLNRFKDYESELEKPREVDDELEKDLQTEVQEGIMEEKEK